MNAFLLALEGLNRAFKLVAEVGEFLAIFQQENDLPKALLKAAMKARGVPENYIEWVMGELGKLEFDESNPGAFHASVNYLVATVVEKTTEVIGWQG